MEIVREQGRQRKGKEGASLQLPGRPKWETEAAQNLAEKEAEAWWTKSA